MLPARERLRSNRHFQEVYKRGRTYPDRLVIVHVLRVATPASRLSGFVVSKKVGKACVRNQVKRRLREVYRLLLPTLPLGYHAVVVARRQAADADYEQLRASLCAALVKAGLLQLGQALPVAGGSIGASAVAKPPATAGPLSPMPRAPIPTRGSDAQAPPPSEGPDAQAPPPSGGPDAQAPPPSGGTDAQAPPPSGGPDAQALPPSEGSETSPSRGSGEDPPEVPPSPA